MKRTNIDFIEKSNIIHNNKYDYSLVDYINGTTKVKMMCKKCNNIFEQKPEKHLIGQGCPICANNTLLTNDIFIKNANLIHNNKYDYSLVNYINNNTKVKIICKEHGIFEQIPTNHISKKQGCPKCNGGIKNTKDNVIKRANIIHNNKYDYSLVDYQNANKKVKIICPIHGVFEQSISCHINRKYGCPICSESKGEKEIRNILEKNDIKYEYQKTFSGCVYKQELKFDFYLPNKNLCIEYNGKQHYEANSFFGGEEGFKETRKRDNIKNKYCKNNNIKLIKIKYNKNIENEINKIIV